MNLPFGDLLDRWFSTTSTNHPKLDPCLQQCSTLISPLLPQSRGYPGDYRKALHHALHYADALVEQIPPAIELSTAKFSTDPWVRALFASPAELEQTLQLSIAMRDYRPPLTGEQTLYALMGVRWERKQQFGMEQHNGMIQSDVPQQVINFKDHTFTLPAASEHEAREQLHHHFVERLAKQVKQQISELKQQRDKTYLEIKKLESALRHQLDDTQLQQRLEQLQQEWQRLGEQLNLDHAIEHFRAVMEQPEQVLRLEPLKLSIDRMGVERPAEAGGEPLQLLNLHGADRRIWTIMLVSFPWVPPRSSKEQLAEAYRWLAIS